MTMLRELFSSGSYINGVFIDRRLIVREAEPTMMKDVIKNFGGHDVSDEARDENGRFSDGGSTAEHPDKHAAKWESSGSLKDDLDYARDADEVRQSLEHHGATEVDFDTPGVSPVWVSKDGDSVIEWNGEDNDVRVSDAKQWVFDANVADYYPDYEENFNKDGWASGGEVYHATQDENVDSILENGIGARDETRGMSNRDTGAAVFTTSSMDEAEAGSYGNNIFAIDLGAMKKDGYTPRLSQEPAVVEYDLREALAHRLGLEDFNQDSADDMSPSTVVIEGNVPAKYIRLISGEKAKSLGHDVSDEARDEGGRFAVTPGAGGKKSKAPRVKKSKVADAVIKEKAGEALREINAREFYGDRYDSLVAQYGRDETVDAAESEQKIGVMLKEDAKVKATHDEFRNRIHSPQFKTWFGDWEHDPKNASKIVDTKGEPSKSNPYSKVVDDKGVPEIVYHGTTHEFDQFSDAHGNPRNDMGKGFYFSESSKDVEEHYATVESPDLRNRIYDLQDKLEQGSPVGKDIGTKLDKIRNPSVAKGKLGERTGEPWEKVKDKVGKLLDEKVAVGLDKEKAMAMLAANWDKRGDADKAIELDNPSGFREELARASLAGDKPKMLECYLNIRNPVVLDFDDTKKGAWGQTQVLSSKAMGTKFEAEWIYQDDKGRHPGDKGYDEDNSYPGDKLEGNGQKLIDAMHAVVAKGDYALDQHAGNRLVEKVTEKFTNDGVLSAMQFKTMMMESDELNEAQYKPDGDSASPQFVADVFKHMGYDGVIYSDASKHFIGMEIPKGTRHFVAWNPVQIKSVDSKTFSPTNPNIFKSIGRVPRKGPGVSLRAPREFPTKS